MTSASELFYNRRSRLGRNAELGLGSSLDRDPNHHYQHHHRHYRHHRHDEDCDPVRRSSHSPSLHAWRLFHRVSQMERELVHNSSQPGMGDGSGMVTSSIRTDRPRFTRYERLPGSVLEARARLLERLRGVSLTGNRQNSGVSGISWDEFAVSDDFRAVDTGGWESEMTRDWLVDAAPFSDLAGETLLDVTEKKPPGLSLEAINSLQREVFSVASKDGILRAVQECCICLESFHEADELIRLPCGHRFHPMCLDPWVRTCGDCPYCRMGIVVDYGVEEKTLDPC